MVLSWDYCQYNSLQSCLSPIILVTVTYKYTHLHFSLCCTSWISFSVWISIAYFDELIFIIMEDALRNYSKYCVKVNNNKCLFICRLRDYLSPLRNCKGIDILNSWHSFLYGIHCAIGISNRRSVIFVDSEWGWNYFLFLQRELPGKVVSHITLYSWIILLIFTPALLRLHHMINWPSLLLHTSPLDLCLAYCMHVVLMLLFPHYSALINMHLLAQPSTSSGTYQIITLCLLRLLPSIPFKRYFKIDFD